MYDEFETLRVSKPGPHLLHVEINRPSRSNAMNSKFWSEFRECFNHIAEDSAARVVIISGTGKNFSAGLDIADNSDIKNIMKSTNDAGRRAFRLRNLGKAMQASFNAVEQCPQPVIAAIHGACIGGAVDLACACDMRLCSADARFSIAEVAVGLAADLGTLQRMPKIIGNGSLCRELAYTARTFLADEAASMGFVSRALPAGSGREEVVEASFRLAAEIAEHSPVAVYGTKRNLLYARNHSVEDGLEYGATWNGAALQTEDLGKAMAARLKKGEAPLTFSKL